MNKAIIIGRLTLMAVLIVMRWCFQPFNWVSLALHTFFSEIVGSLGQVVNYLQKMNDELIKKAKR